MINTFLKLGILLMISQHLYSKPVIIAHRGASGYLPEHTLPAASMAYALGADFIEPDVVLTKDDIPIILHDISLEETTDVAEKFPERKRKDGHFYAIDFTLQEIKSLNAHERRHTDGKVVFRTRFPQGLSKFEVPTLSEMIELVLGLNQSTGKHVGLYPELKAPLFHQKEGKDIAKITHELVASYDFKKAPFFWQCFHAETLKRLHAEFHSPYPLILLIDDGDLSLEDPKKLEEEMKKISTFSQGIGPAISHIFNKDGRSTQVVALAHKYKILVHPYTARKDSLPSYVKSFDELLEKLFIEEKIDGLFTDFTDLTHQYREAHPKLISFNK